MGGRGPGLTDPHRSAARLRPRYAETATAKGDRSHRAYVWFERTVLSAGMTALALGIERVLVGAIKKGGVEPAPRTAASGRELAPVAPSESREAQLSARTGTA